MIRRFRFKEVRNCRELGGYQISTSTATKWGRYIRCDDPHQLQEKEQDVLKKKGLTAVIDLRSKAECEESENPFANKKDIRYIHCPLTFMKNPMNDVPRDLATTYRLILEDHQFIKEVFTSLARVDGMVMFHCSAGKDRTGVIAYLLLELMGVQKEDILNDYQQSYINIKTKINGHEKNVMSGFTHLLHSNPETLLETMDYLTKEYGNVYDYLRICKVETKDIRRLIDNFISEM